MIKLLKIVLLFPFYLIADDFCIFKNVLITSKVNTYCVFEKSVGTFSFVSDSSKHNYEYNLEFDVMILTEYKIQIEDFINRNCQKKGITVKEVINFNYNEENYLTKVFIQCNNKYGKNNR
tara:strand:+ start:753 stop:1112 length:360 start_codon:yes stop_codon:yes gene_type:complete